MWCILLLPRKHVARLLAHLPSTLAALTDSHELARPGLLPDGLDASVDLLRRALAADLLEGAEKPNASTRAGVSAFAAAVRSNGLWAEHGLILLKAAWTLVAHAPPLQGRLKTNILLDRVVTLYLDEYYAAPEAVSKDATEAKHIPEVWQQISPMVPRDQLSEPAPQIAPS